MFGVRQSWEPLRGTTTLLRAREAFLNGDVYGGEGGSLQSGEQFMITEDAVQVVDLLIVRTSFSFGTPWG